MAILRQNILQQNMMVPKMFQQNLNFYDCKLISSEGRQKLTNKIVLASKSKFLSQLLGELPQCSDSVVMFPDYALEDIEILLECIVDTESSRESRLINDLLVIHNHKKPSLDPTEVIDDLKACPVISVEENFDVDDPNAVQEIDRNDNKYINFERSLKDTNRTLNCEVDSLVDREIESSNEQSEATEFDGASMYLTAFDKKKKVRLRQKKFEEAIDDFLSGKVNSLSQAAKKHGLPQSTLYGVLVHRGGKFVGSGQNHSRLLTDAEEEIIAKTALEKSNHGKGLTWPLLRDIMIEEVENIKKNEPGRDIFRISAKTGTLLNVSYVRRFADRTGLSPYILKRFTVQTRPFVCKLCEKAFSFKNALVKHMKTQHM